MKKAEKSTDQNGNLRANKSRKSPLLPSATKSKNQKEKAPKTTKNQREKPPKQNPKNHQHKHKKNSP